MFRWFVVMEAWDGDSDYEVFDVLARAACRWVELSYADEWAGVWREVKVMELAVSDAETTAYEEANGGECWSFWNHNDEAALIHSWVAPNAKPVS